jgi:hypothetical protein
MCLVPWEAKSLGLEVLLNKKKWKDENYLKDKVLPSMSMSMPRSFSYREFSFPQKGKPTGSACRLLETGRSLFARMSCEVQRGEICNQAWAIVGRTSNSAPRRHYLGVVCGCSCRPHAWLARRWRGAFQWPSYRKIFQQRLTQSCISS